MCAMMNQTDIAAYFKDKYGTKLDQARISRIMRGEDQISWPFARDLSREFPEKDIAEWKDAEPEDLKKAFEQLKNKET